MTMSTSWRFNPAEWKVKLKALCNVELRALFCHHLNYVPNSPVTHLALAEMKTRGMKV